MLMDGELFYRCPFWPCGLLVSIVTAVVGFLIGKKFGGKAS